MHMKIVGLIAEYNPFHNGHAYHIRKAKAVTGADYCIVIMSGNYVQRGTPAVISKYDRTRMALESGADLVLELPVSFSTSSAELFAKAAVSLLDHTGIVDCLCFGSECNNIDALSRIADILLAEPARYRHLLKNHLKNGQSYPAARMHAVSEYLDTSSYVSVLNDPNNILGIEYLKALKKLDSPIRPYTIRRAGSHYHDRELSHEHLSSASAIRSLLAYSGSALQTDLSGGTFEDSSFSGILNELEEQVPSCCLELLKDYHRISYPVYQNDFSLILKYKLLNKQPESLVRYMDVSEELANRICGQLDNFFNYKQFCELLKTRETTQTRINRALLHIMLGIKKEDVSEYINSGYHSYARLLGVRKDKQKILAHIAKKSSLTLLTRLADSDDLPAVGRKMLRNDILASNLYTSVVTNKYKTAYQNEYKQRILKI